MAPDATKSILVHLKNSSVTQWLSDTSLRYLADHSVLKRYKKGDAIWRRGEAGDYCVLILRGLVEITSISQSGDARIIGVFGPGEIIGLSAILKQITFPANALLASREGEVIQFYIRGLAQLLEDETKRELQSWTREMLLLHEQILRDKIMILGAGRINIKIIELIQHFKVRFAPSTPANSFLIPIPITKTQIAKMVEARTETVIRMLNVWEKAGFLKMNESGFAIERFDELKKQEGVL